MAPTLNWGEGGSGGKARRKHKSGTLSFDQGGWFNSNTYKAPVDKKSANETPFAADNIDTPQESGRKLLDR